VNEQLSRLFGRQRELTVRVRCGACKYVHRLERKFAEPEEVHIVCHYCEAWLTVHVTADQIAAKGALA
jgi:hypothetical protein